MGIEGYVARIADAFPELVGTRFSVRRTVAVPLPTTSQVARMPKQAVPVLFASVTEKVRAGQVRVTLSYATLCLLAREDDSCPVFLAIRHPDRKSLPENTDKKFGSLT